MNPVADSGGDLPVLKNDGRTHVYLGGIIFNKIYQIFLIIIM